MGGIRRKEAIHALERRRNTILSGDGQMRMQTLGARNEFVRNNKNRGTLDSKRRGDPFNAHNGALNAAFDRESDDSEGEQQMNLNIYSPGSRYSGNSGQRQSQDL